MAPPLPPTPADDPILAALARYHVLTAAQVQRLLYAAGSRKYASLRLGNLVAGGYVLVDYPAPPRRAGRARGVYQLATRGRRYATEVLELDLGLLPRFRPSEQTARSYSFYAHTLAANDVLIAAELLARQRSDVTLLEVRHELDLKRSPLRIPATSSTRAGGERRGEALVPDGFLLLRLEAGAQARRFPICFEVDRGHEGQGVWRGKVRRYLAAFAGPLEEAFGVRRATVAVFAPGAARRDWLRVWTATELASQGAAGAAARFLLTDVDPAAAAPEALFLSPAFVPPSEGATAEALLVPPAGVG